MRSTLGELNLNWTREAWAQAFNKNLDFRLVQLPEILHSLHWQGARASKRIRMLANVFSYLSMVVIKAEKLMGPSQKKKEEIQNYYYYHCTVTNFFTY